MLIWQTYTNLRIISNIHHPGEDNVAVKVNIVVEILLCNKHLPNFETLRRIILRSHQADNKHIPTSNALFSHIRTTTLVMGWLGFGLCVSLQWRHNERDGVSNHCRLDCLHNRLSRRRSKKTSKLHLTGLYEGNSPHKDPVTRKRFHLMTTSWCACRTARWVGWSVVIGYTGATLDVYM